MILQNLMSMHMQRSGTCSASIVRITDFSNWGEDSHRPQILFSGEIHGDERVVSKK